jgi:hypothetical protein
MCYIIFCHIHPKFNFDNKSSMENSAAEQSCYALCDPRHSPLCETTNFRREVQGDQKVSVHLIITIQKVTSNVQSVFRQSPDIY